MSNTISPVAPTSAELANELFARIVSLQKRMMDDAGENTLKLIQSAILPHGQGQNLDISA